MIESGRDEYGDCQIPGHGHNLQIIVSNKNSDQEEERNEKRK